MPCSRPVVVAALPFLLMACGGDIRADELQRGVQSLGSLAAEGALVADGAAQDRTKRTFTRVQARTLGEEADHEAEKVSDASAPPALEQKKAATVKLATDVGDALGRLQTAPGDAQGAAQAARPRPSGQTAGVEPMKTVLSIALGIIAAIGGFVDIGDLVFNMGAGATFGYQLLWAVPIGVLGIMVFAEMSGRVAAVAGRASFDLVSEHFSRRLALLTLVASLVLSFFTLAAELGGMGMLIDLWFDVSPAFFTLVAVTVVTVAAGILSFEAIERSSATAASRCWSTSWRPFTWTRTGAGSGTGSCRASPARRCTPTTPSVSSRRR
jgi:Natural resistance-associated macrophage protein-like